MALSLGSSAATPGVRFYIPINGGGDDLPYAATPNATLSVLKEVTPAGQIIYTLTGIFSATGAQTVTLGDKTGRYTATITSTAATAPSLSGTAGSATVGAAYSFQPALTGGAGGGTWRIASGSLPDGLSMNPRTGLISGTPSSGSTTGSATITYADIGGMATALPVAVTVTGGATFGPSTTSVTASVPTQVPIAGLLAGETVSSVVGGQMGANGTSVVVLTSSSQSVTVTTSAGRTITFTVSGGGGPVTPVNLFANTITPKTIVGAPQGRVLAAIPNVPNGVSATVTMADGAVASRVQISGTGANTTLQVGSAGLAAGSYSATITSPGMNPITLPISVVAVPSALLAATGASQGLFKTIASYAGAAISVQAVSDRAGTLVGSAFDVPFIGGAGAAVGAHIDHAAMFAQAVTNGGINGYVRVLAVYDQQTAARHLTVTGANAPWMDRRLQVNGIQPINFNSNRENATANTADGPDNFLQLPASYAVNRQNFSVFMACAPYWSRNNANFITFGTTAATWQMQMQMNAGFVGLYVGQSGNRVGSGLHPRAQESVLGYSATSTDQRIYMREQEISGVAATAATMASGAYIGSSGIVAQSSFTVKMDWYGMSWHLGLNSADSQTMVAFWAALINAPTAFTARIVTDGDSIEQCAKGVRDQNSALQIARRTVIGCPEWFNLGISGVKIYDGTPSNVSILNNIADDKALYTSSIRVIYKLRAAGNDLLNARTGAQAYANAADYVGQMKAQGSNVRVAHATITGITAFNDQVLIYGNAVKANTAGADAVIDYSTTVPGAIDGSQPTLTYFPPALTTTPTTADTHPNEAAIALMAPVDVSVFNGLLAGTV